jgi:hypothetical protein
MNYEIANEATMLTENGSEFRNFSDLGDDAGGAVL